MPWMRCGRGADSADARARCTMHVTRRLRSTEDVGDKQNVPVNSAMLLQAKRSAQASTGDAADSKHGASTSSTAEVSSSGVESVEVPPATDLETGGFETVDQQPTSDIATVVEVPQPLPRLRQRRPPPVATPMTSRTHIRGAGSKYRERLAELVRSHPVLYDTNCAHFKDKAQTHYAWQDISTRMLRPDTECIKMWKRLRCGYTRALRVCKHSKEQGVDVKSPKYEKFMSFVKPFLKGSKTASPASAATDEAARPGYVPVLPAQTQRNTIVELFRNLGETVKDFPRDVKIRVKSEVFRVVNEAREFILSNNTVEQLFVVEDIVIKEEPSDLE